jgi:glyoxylase-like metal-dependent hydrolase (beta-lactamase superfamily II)
MLFSRLKIPLSGMELGHVNVYVLRCKDGYGLVDVGLAAYDRALSLVKGLMALGIRLTEITKVYITHFHAHHITLGQFLARRCSHKGGGLGHNRRTYRQYIRGHCADHRG